MSPIAGAILMATATAAVIADDFGTVQYDPKHDQLIVTITYDGTNPDHQFSIHWGQCRKRDKPGETGKPDNPPREIVVSLLDDQPSDVARSSYTKIVTVALAAVACRPARVTLWTTPAFYGPEGRPGARASVDIP